MTRLTSFPDSSVTCLNGRVSGIYAFDAGGVRTHPLPLGFSRSWMTCRECSLESSEVLGLAMLA